MGFKYLSKKNGGNGGVILNTSSLTAFFEMYALPVYSATKSAVLQLTRNFGHPYHTKDTGLSVIALCPGYTPTTKFFTNANCLTEELETALNLLTPGVKEQK